jgi:regulator of protease activity HflC (stomatin/prohibitin superfamily)
VIGVTLFALPAFGGLALSLLSGNPWAVGIGVAVGIVLGLSPQMAQQWERAVVLRLGRYQGLHGPGLFWIVPFIDRVPAWIDQRTITSSLPRNKR